MSYRAYAWTQAMFRAARPSQLRCTQCDGAGFIGGDRYAATGTLTDIKTCPNCEGRGYSGRVVPNGDR